MPRNQHILYGPIRVVSIAISVLGFGFDLGEDDIDVGGLEVVVEQFEISAKFGKFGAVHRRLHRRPLAAEHTERPKHLFHD